MYDRPLLSVLLSALLLMPLGARAADPSLAAYRADGSRVLWFMQITDTHIDSSFLGQHEEEYLAWALSEGFYTVQPDFMVVTGDLVDGSNGLVYNGPYEDEWTLYRALVEEAGMTDPSLYIDLPGNHDAYSDGGLTHYLQYSTLGSVTGRTQAGWRVDRAFGATCFFGLATPGNDGAPWPQDHATLTAGELAELEDFLSGNPECRVSVTFGHHDVTVEGGASTFKAMAEAYGVGHYIHGHDHDLNVAVDGDLVILRTDSLGQGSDHNVTVFALDHDTLSFGSVGADDPWPLAVITAPVHGEYEIWQRDVWGDDWAESAELPHAPPVPTGCEAAPVRVLAFDPQGVSAAHFRVDGSPWHGLDPREDNPHQWRGHFDASAFPPGWHDLSVEIIASKTRTVSARVRFVDAPCDVGEEDDDPGPLPEAPDVEVVEPEVDEPDAQDSEVIAPDVVEPEIMGPDSGAPDVEPLESDAGAAPSDDTHSADASKGPDQAATADAVTPGDDEDATPDGWLGTKPRPEGEGAGGGGCSLGDARRGAGPSMLLLLALALFPSRRRRLN